MRGRSRAVGLLGAVCAVVLPFAVGDLASQAASDPPRATPIACDDPVCYLRGWPPVGNPPTTHHQRRLLEIAERLGEDDTAGSYVQDDGDVAVVWVGARGHRVADRLFAGREGVDLLEGDVSYRRAGDLGAALIDRHPPFGSSIVMWGADAVRGRLQLVGNRRATAADQEMLERFAARHDVAIDAWFVRGLDGGSTD